MKQGTHSLPNIQKSPGEKVMRREAVSEIVTGTYQYNTTGKPWREGLRREAVSEIVMGTYQYNKTGKSSVAIRLVQR